MDALDNYSFIKQQCCKKIVSVFEEIYLSTVQDILLMTAVIHWQYFLGILAIFLRQKFSYMYIVFHLTCLKMCCVSESSFTITFWGIFELIIMESGAEGTLFSGFH